MNECITKKKYFNDIFQKNCLSNFYNHLKELCQNYSMKNGSHIFYASLFWSLKATKTAKMTNTTH